MANECRKVELQDLFMPPETKVLIHNISEATAALTLSSSEEDQLNILVLDGKFLLIDISRCFNCRFRAVMKPVATKYECNSTLKLPRGSFKLMKHSTFGSCILLFEAPAFHRVFLKVVDMLPLRSGSTSSEACSLRQLVVEPLTGVPKQKIWSACNNFSQAQTELYISESNSLKVQWDNKFEDVLLNYEYFPLCANRTLGDTSSGHFCSPGYPDIFFGCNTSYSIYVPFGFSIELKLSVLGVTAGAFCQNNSLEVLTRNATHGEKTLLGLCLDAVDGQKDIFTLHSFDNRLDIRIRPKEDLPRKGFCASYRAIANDPSTVLDCPYGWVPGQKFCYKIFDKKLSWISAEELCQMKGGHLASITDNRIALLIDDIILNSPSHETNNAYWIGANDLRYENCYEWTDGQAFDFFYWFPGWENYGWYSVQPSDDGLSQQNCVELRNLFRYPSKGEGITERFFWNDRDCDVANPFICQRLKPGVSLEPVYVPACNRSILLNWEHLRDTITSPGFPNNYPNNVECHYYISTTHGKRIVALFTDFILEESESCEYDVMILREDKMKWRRCGNWEDKIKLLRYISHGNTIHLTFSSDFSHSFKGFRIEFSILSEQSTKSALCDNDMFQLKGSDCYLVVNYPETSWNTARQICSEAKAKLAVIENADQVPILDELVRSTFGYMSGVIYWVGAYSPAHNSSWKWIDGTSLNTANMRILRSDDSQRTSCLAIQWKHLRNSNALRWTAKNCNHPGRFICKKPSVVVPEELNKTVSQMNGNLTSLNYPSNYLNDLDYIVEIIGPPNSRIVLTFHHIDLEWQEDCLYDYILLQTDLKDSGVKLCGENPNGKEFVSSGNKAYLSFHSDFSITAPGYEASWEIVDLSVCLNRRLLILEPTHISSLRYPRSYLSKLECQVTVIASSAKQRLLLTITDLDLGHCSDAFLEINLDPIDESKKVKLCGNDLLSGTQLMAYGNEAHLFFHSGDGKNVGSLGHKGYNVTCQTWADTKLETTLYLNTRRKGRIYSLNFNHAQPIGLNYSQRIIVPIGNKIHLQSPNMSQPSVLLPSSCDGSGLLVRDNYAMQKTLLFWSPCKTTNFWDNDGFWSTLHVLSIHAWNYDGNLPTFFFDYSVGKDDHFVNTTLSIESDSIESCKPNPCQHGGRCIKNGTTHKCHCFGQYTGLFCHLTWCDTNVCGENGICNLTANGWTCECLSGYTGPHCQQTMTPCVPNPCESDGVCSIRNGTFSCLCGPEYEGAHCEKFVLRIPYKPLSQRMLEEPFWLGLITVFTVLLIILFVYCIKRKFADKIEKFLAEEIERSKYQPSPPATRYSLSSTQPSLTPGNQSPQTCPKSFFNRIRKNSLLSAACSPSPNADREQPRTFSFDDILRRVHSSKRNRTSSTNQASSGASTSTADVDTSKEDTVKKEDEKSRILASLVTSNKEAASRRMSLDEFFRMSERKLQLSAKRTNSAAESTESEGRKETSFISVPSPKTLRQSFSEIQSIREQSIEYVSSSESLSCEPSTSEIQADVSPTPITSACDQKSLDEDMELNPPETPTSQTQSAAPSPTPTEHSAPPSISIVIEPCDSESKQDSESDEKNCDSESKSSVREAFRPLSPVISRKSSYLEVPHPIPAIHVFSAEGDESHCFNENNCPMKQERFDCSSPSKKEFVPIRKYSVDLPTPKILITANMTSCDSDEASPPRTPNPNKSMMYLSPLAVISSSTDRTISESNLSTSGYSSISSPGLSRCNSSSPISDDIEHQHHSNGNRKPELQSPKKPHGLQMTYLSVGGNDKAFFFPPTIACHCHTPNQPAPVVFEPKNAPAVPSVWTAGKHRLLYKRNSYQTTSTDDSIDDEGIGMDTIDFKIRKGEVRSAHDLEIFIASEKTASPPAIPSPIMVEACKPDLLTCSVNNKSGNGSSFKGSPRAATRKGEKPKKYMDKHRRSPIMSPASTPVKDHGENAESRIPRNSSRTSISGPLVSSSESDDQEGYLGARQKNQTRRSKKQHETSGSTHKQPLISLPSQDSSGPKTDKSSDANGRSSPLSESNGDSAPMDSRSPASSSSDSLPSTRDSAISEKIYCTRHKPILEHTRSYPPPSHSSRHYKDEIKGLAPKSKLEVKKMRPPPIIQLASEEDITRSTEEHPCLRRQEAIVEDEPSDDSSSETTVLLRRPLESPRNMQQSSSADVSEWEAFTKE
ncbi:uncharacterized protein LOC129218337 [Uloborus diversus]|uniref:uncharacterized protein LOC129218337 n=1 Tax=Uloborus diversus TaxID=327109 RepID=UPI002409DF42|nr:uncharacterized protein LOC129218337 [Uloborus diversus]